MVWPALVVLALAGGAFIGSEALRAPRPVTRYTEDDLHVRQFSEKTTRRVIRKGAFRAA